MFKLGWPVVYTVPEVHHARTVVTQGPNAGEHEGSVHHQHLRTFAATVGRIHPDGTADLHILIPNKDAKWVERVPFGEGHGTFALLETVSYEEHAAHAEQHGGEQTGEQQTGQISEEPRDTSGD